MIIVDETFLMHHSPGLSETLLPIKSFEPYRPKGPENVIITKLYRCSERRQLLKSLNNMKRDNLETTTASKF